LADTQLNARPADKRILTLRALAEEKLGNNQEALKSFHQVLRVDASYFPALKGAVEVEYKTRDPKAARDLDALLATTPDDKTAHAMRAAIAAEHKDCGLAITHFAA